MCTAARDWGKEQPSFGIDTLLQPRSVQILFEFLCNQCNKCAMHAFAHEQPVFVRW